MNKSKLFQIYYARYICLVIILCEKLIMMKREEVYLKIFVKKYGEYIYREKSDQKNPYL